MSSIVFHQTAEGLVELHRAALPMIPPAVHDTCHDHGTTTHADAGANVAPVNACICAVQYNVHSGVGIDGRYSIQRQSQAITGMAADIACLQEVECNVIEGQTRKWSHAHAVDQTAQLSELTGLSHHIFSPEMRCRVDPTTGSESKHSVLGHLTNWREQAVNDRHNGFGIAVLSRWPLLEQRTLYYTTHTAWSQRNAIAVLVAPPCVGEIWVVCTHFGARISGQEQTGQARELAAFIESTLTPRCDRILIGGDLNSPPIFAAPRLLRRNFIDLWRPASAFDFGKTFPAQFPLKLWRIDYFLSSPALLAVLNVHDTAVVDSAVSDHCALRCRLGVRNQL
jgi:endonuclease/exonuclease/phosphatase family metal-dependent hydrolase